MTEPKKKKGFFKRMVTKPHQGCQQGHCYRPALCWIFQLIIHETEVHLQALA